MARSFNATYYYAKKHLNYNVPTRAEWELHQLLENKNRGMLDVLDTLPKNDTIITNATKCWSKINSRCYDSGRICCSISGGSDSDIVLDLIRRCDPNRKVFYYFIDTGLESYYTKQHLDYLQLKYQVKIHRFKAKTPIPLAVRREGIPFLSKQVSEFLMRLQQYGFEYDDSDDLESLCEKYCKKLDDDAVFDIEELGIRSPGRYTKIGSGYYYGCVSALAWWCNKKSESGTSMFNINYNTYLKEFLIQTGGVPFKVANKCCKLSKKDTIKQVTNELQPELEIQGVRKSEGGVRASAYKSCFTESSYRGYDEYRPVFWYKDSDKKEYDEYCGIHHSKLYDYMKRTGCLGCPFGRDIESEVIYASICEPQMAKAMGSVFGPSYTFTKKYREFQKQMKSASK